MRIFKSSPLQSSPLQVIYQILLRKKSGVLYISNFLWLIDTLHYRYPVLYRVILFSKRENKSQFHEKSKGPHGSRKFICNHSSIPNLIRHPSPSWMGPWKVPLYNPLPPSHWLESFPLHLPYVCEMFAKTLGV